MAKGTVEVVIDPKGNVTIAATGFRGAACEQATKEIEEALGTVTSKKKTPEAYLKDSTAAQASLKR